MHIKSFSKKDRHGNEMSVEFFDVPEMKIPEYDHPGDPKGTDTVPAWLTPGEFVINAEATRKYEPLLTEINNEGREIQAEQGGSIPEGGTVPNEPVYASSGFFNDITRNIKRNTKRLKRDPSKFLNDFVKDTVKGVERVIPSVPEISIEIPEIEVAPKIPGAKIVDPTTGEVIKQYYNTVEDLSDDGIIIRSPGGSGIYRPKDKDKTESRGGTILDFGEVLFEADGGQVPMYAAEGFTGFLNKYILGPNAQIETEDDDKNKKTSNVPPIALNVSANPDDTLTSFLKAEEGMKNEAYLDSAGVPTIGYGSTYGVKMGDKLSDAEANQKLIRDMAVVDDDYSKLVDVDLNPNQQAAVKSLLFNIGGPQFANSKARAALNAGDFETFQKEAAEFRMADGKVIPGLENRRAREAALFNTPIEGDPTLDESSVPPVTTPEPPKDDEPFSIFGFQPFADNRPDSVKARNAEFDRKISNRNAKEVASSFKEMEIKREANIAAGRPEFEGINEKTYRGLKNAVEFQKDNVIEDTKESLDLGKVDPGLAEAAMEATRQEVSELGVPTPEEKAIAATPEYQDHIRRAAAAGIKPKSPDEFREFHTPNKDGQSPADRAAPLSDNSKTEESVSKAVTDAQTETDNNKNQTEDNNTNKAKGVIEQLGPVDTISIEGEKSINDFLNSLDDGSADNDTKSKFEEIMGTAGEWFKGAFADMFSGPELARMAITYAGSRLMGYDHGGSLQYSMKNYIDRVDSQVAARQEFITDEDNLDLYTKESLNAYRKSGNIEDLVEKNAGAAPTMVETSGQAYLTGYGRVEKFKDADGIEYVNLEGKNIPVSQVASYIEPWNESVHGRPAMQKTFSDQFESSAASLNAAAGLYDGEDKDTRIKFDSKGLGVKAEQVYSEILRQNAVSLRDAPQLQIEVNDAISKFVEDTIAYQQGKTNTEPLSIRAYINNETRAVLTGIPNTMFTNASESINNKLDRRIKAEVQDDEGNKLSPKDPGYAEEYQRLWKASYAAFMLQDKYPDISSKNMEHWETRAAESQKDKDKAKHHSAFTRWMTSTPVEEVQAIIEASNLDGNLEDFMLTM